jgi:putative serine protease PepD
VADAAGNQAVGQVLGFDRANDLAVIQIDVAEFDVQAVTLADSDLADVGQWVAAIGSPFGLDQTLTTGVVSAIERTRAGATERPQRGLIQTDAAINPGNSGGVLVDAQGDVLGITNSVESPIRGSVGVGFAIPSNVLARFLDQMIAGEQITHPWIGISAEFGADSGDLAIGTVVRNAPAERAGIEIGDRLLRIDGTMLVEFEQLAQLLDGHDVGDQVTFEIDRNGSTIMVDVELGAWPG